MRLPCRGSNKRMVGDPPTCQWCAQQVNQNDDGTAVQHDYEETR